MPLSLFDDVPPIVVHDPLLKLIGPSPDGRIAYRYADAVNLAGHSCPTVAGAFLMASKALAFLYGGATPERGAISVELRDGRTAGVAGVQARIFSLITGAAEEDGFKGLLGRFDRRGLLAFDASIPALARFTRTDTGAAILVDYHPEAVPIAISPRHVMERILAGTASVEEEEAVRELWQNRVRRILVTERDNPALITLSPPVPAAA